MLVEDFSQKVLSSNIVNTYVATAFFATLIFFVLNANSYTPMEMMTGVVLVTIAFKGISNMMLSLIILLFNLKPKDDSVDFERSASNVNSLLNELSLQKAKIKTNQNLKE
ncbi:MAG TPA: hypothetical protein EYG97_00130 [Arcobacter sp.]|nr:hypothetical protein [Arcobacter sp.]HIP55415.1 hypothetical protein [Arcobacter sp.]